MSCVFFVLVRFLIYNLHSLAYRHVAFTIIVVFSSFATAVTAAFLTKDTKISKDNLTNTKKGHILGTQTTKETCAIDPEFDEFISRQRHLDDIDFKYRTQGLMSVPMAVSEKIVSACEIGKVLPSRRSGKWAPLSHTISAPLSLTQQM